VEFFPCIGSATVRTFGHIAWLWRSSYKRVHLLLRVTAMVDELLQRARVGRCSASTLCLLSTLGVCCAVLSSEAFRRHFFTSAIQPSSSSIAIWYLCLWLGLEMLDSSSFWLFDTVSSRQQYEPTMTFSGSPSTVQWLLLDDCQL